MKILLIILLGFLTSISVRSQNVYTLDNDLSTIRIKGTSSLHDWESNVEKFEGSILTEIEAQKKITSITDLSISIDVKSIKSGKRIMDGKTYSALEDKKHPKIYFKFSELIKQTQDSVFIKGFLTIAGKELEVDIAGAYQIFEDLSIKIIGIKKLLMTDYNIKPPKAMLGTLKTGDEIEIVFDVIFKTNQ
jgi:polyisoprenoid-binding protein YceI